MRQEFEGKHNCQYLLSGLNLFCRARQEPQSKAGPRVRIEVLQRADLFSVDKPSAGPSVSKREENLAIASHASHSRYKN
jgi:hypothetical protein